MERSLLAEQTVKKRKTMIDDETIRIIKTIPELSGLSKKIKEIVQGSIRMSNTLLIELELFLKNKHKSLNNESIYVDENIIRSFLVLINILIDGKKLSEVYCYQSLMDNLVNYLEVTAISEDIKDMIVQICEQYLESTMELLNPECRVCSCTLYYILNLALNQTNKNYKRDIKRLWKLKHFFKVINFLKVAEDKFQKLFLQTITTPSFIENNYGQIIVAYILLNPSFNLKTIRDKIYEGIPKISESQASGYGEIYFNAWNKGEGSLKEKIEEVFIQDIMERALTYERENLNMNLLGSKLFAVLFSMHNINIYKFKICLTNLYKPLLWRYLQSTKSYERCNAAEILFKAFPLMESGEVRLVASPLREKQIKYMLDLLLDECAVVRIIAVKGVCHCLSHRFDYFSDAHVAQFLEAILDKLLHDKSHEVRTGVFNGFEIMTIEPRSATILFKLLPHIRKYGNDGSEKVRASFWKFLIQLKENLPKEINFGQVLALTEPIKLLIIDTPVIAKLIVKLIVDYFYNKTLPEIVSFRRLVRLTSFNVTAPKLLFMNAEGVLDSADAFLIITSVINKLYILKGTHFQESNISHVSQNLENTKKKMIEDISNQLDDDKELFPTSDDVSELLNDARIISGLILTAAALFGLFKKDLRHYDCYKDSLYTLSVNFFRCFSQLYEGSPVYYAAVIYASNIPSAKLVPAVNIIDKCMIELEKVTEDTHIEIIKALSQSLISWGRNEDVITLAISWLDNSLKNQNLNLMKIKSCKTSKQHAKGGNKLIVALKLINCVFDGSHCQYRLNENNNSLFNLHKCLAQVKFLIERRLTKGSSAFNNERDQSLLQCYKTLIRIQCYMPVTTTLGASSGSKHLTANAVLMEHVKWLNNNIIKYLSQKKNIQSYTIGSLPLTCLLQFFLMVKKHVEKKVTDDEYIEAVARLAIDSLNLECRYLLLEVSIEMLSVFTEYTSSLKSGDGLHLQAHTLPMLLNKILAVLKEENFVALHIFPYCENTDKMLDRLLCHLKCAKHWSSLMVFKETFCTYMSTVINIVLLEERKTKKLKLHTILEELPFLASYIIEKLIEQDIFLPHIMPSINKLISNHNKDALFIRSCLNVIHILVQCKKQKFSREEFEDCLRNANDILCTIRTPSTSRSSTYPQMGDTVEQGKIIIKIISNKLASSARGPPLS